MIFRKHKLQRRNENCSLGLIETVHWQYWNMLHCKRPLAPDLALFQFQKQLVTVQLMISKDQKVSITVLRTKYGILLRPQHKHLTPAAVTFWRHHVFLENRFASDTKYWTQHTSSKSFKKLCRISFKAVEFACNMTKLVFSWVNFCGTHRAETVGIPGGQRSQIFRENYINIELSFW